MTNKYGVEGPWILFHSHPVHFYVNLKKKKHTIKQACIKALQIQVNPDNSNLQGKSEKV